MLAPLLLFLALTPVAAEVHIYTASADESQVPETEAREQFSCADNVYTVAEIDGLAQGTHQLAVEWIDPAGTRREHTRFDFQVFDRQQRIWAWLKLHRAPGTGMLRWLDSSAGMEEFIGRWVVRVAIDEQAVGETSFEVIC